MSSSAIMKRGGASMKELLIMSKKEVSRISILEQLKERKLTQVKAAAALRITDRQVRRIFKRFKRDGPLGLIHTLRGREGNHRIAENLIAKALELIKTKYPDFGPTLAAEKLAEINGLKIDHDTLRRKMIEKGLWLPKQRKPVHRSWRERKDSFGEMVQFDGSHHHWFEKRAPRCVLLASRDDANNLVEAHFVPSEDTLSVFDFWLRYILKHGRPKSIYLDGNSIYKTQRPIQNQGEDFDLTQFERAVEELGIEVIQAHSPQAKGRIENLFETLQDRLIKELRLANISDINEANIFLETFIPKFNGKFAIPPKNQANLHQPPDERDNLEQIFSIQKERTIQNDFTLRYENQYFQLTNPQPTLVLPGQKVTTEKRLNQTIHIRLKDKYLNYIPIDKTSLDSLRQLKAYALTSNPEPPRVYAKPAPNHPWRKFSLTKPIAYQH